MAAKPKRPPHPEIPLGTKCAVWWCTDFAHPHSRTWDGKSTDGVREVLHVSEIGVITCHRDADAHSSVPFTPAQAVAWFARHPLIPLPADIERAAKRNATLAEVPGLWTGHLRRLRDVPEFATGPRDELLRRVGEVLASGSKAGAFKDTAFAKAAKSAATGTPASATAAFVKAAQAAGHKIDDASNGMFLGTLAAAMDKMLAAAPATAAAK